MGHENVTTRCGESKFFLGPWKCSWGSWGRALQKAEKTAGGLSSSVGENSKRQNSKAESNSWWTAHKLGFDRFFTDLSI